MDFVRSNLGTTNDEWRHLLFSPDGPSFRYGILLVPPRLAPARGTPGDYVERAVSGVVSTASAIVILPFMPILYYAFRDFRESTRYESSTRMTWFRSCSVCLVSVPLCAILAPTVSLNLCCVAGCHAGNEGIKKVYSTTRNKLVLEKLEYRLIQLTLERDKIVAKRIAHRFPLDLEYLSEEVSESTKCRVVVYSKPNRVVILKDLKSIPPLRFVKGGLMLASSLNLKSISHLAVDSGHLVVENPIKLEAVEHLTVGGSLYMLNAPELVSFGKWCYVKEYLCLRGAKSLRHLDESISADGDIDVSSSGLISLPASMETVSGDLNLSLCLDLEHVSSTLTQVKGNLVLVGCRNLKSLKAPGSTQNNLEVDGSVNLAYCSSLMELPSEMAVRGPVLDLQFCEKLTSIPLSIFLLASEKLTIRVMGSGIPAERIAEYIMRYSENNNVTIDEEFHPPAKDSSVSLATIREAAVFFGGYDLDVEKYIDPAYVEPVLRFLSKLRSSDEFASMPDEITKKVRETLVTICNDAQAREEIVVRMADAVDACNDKPIWTLNQMTLITKIAHARGNLQEMRELGLGVMRLGIVQKHAKEIMQSGGHMDDVSVYLALEIILKDELNLPVSASSCSFGANFSHQVVNAIRDEARAITDDSEEFEEWLKLWPEWQREMRSSFAEAYPYDKIPGPVVEMDVSDQTNFIGDPLEDPVLFNGKLYSYAELIRRWVETGMDFYNVVWESGEDILAKLQKVKQSNNTPSGAPSLPNAPTIPTPTNSELRKSLSRMSQSVGGSIFSMLQSFSSQDSGSGRNSHSGIIETGAPKPEEEMTR